MHKYFLCPNCKQTVRVPRGRGQITITCPKCKQKFDKKVKGRNYFVSSFIRFKCLIIMSANFSSSSWSSG